MSHRPTFIPTLDISQGKAVLVQHGKVYNVLGDAMEKANFLSMVPHFQVVDIDAAMETGNNRELIKQICQKYRCYAGGGIRTYEDACDILNSSAKRVIVSTAIDDLIGKVPKDRMIVAFDIDLNFGVFSKGRLGKMQETLFELIEKYKDQIEMMTITFHDAEGTCSGIPFKQVQEIKQFIDEKGMNIKLVFAGGLAKVEELEKLFKMNVVPQFGSGFWNGKFTLGDVFKAMSGFISEKKCVEYQGTKLIPTIVQSVDGQVLGLVFSTPETIKSSVDSRIATFFSRDQMSVWIKGATSGNYFKLKHIHYCCDGTSVRFVVEGDNFCHTGSESCFGNTDPARASLKSVQRLLQMRLASGDEKSYTRKLMNDGYKVHSKVLEEAEELVCASRPEEIIHEAADLLYFILMFLEKQSVSVEDVESELIKRQYTVLKSGFDIEIKNKEKFKVGVVLNNIDTTFVFEYLEDMFNTKIKKANNSARCLKFICERDDVMIIPVKPKDISTLVNNGFLDAVVSYEDIILNYPTNVEKMPITKNKTKQVSIVVACREEDSLEKFRQENKNRKLTVMAEYVLLADKWLELNDLKAKVVHVAGSSESYVVNDLCDMCVVVCDSGKTLKDNGMKVLDTLVTTNVGMFVHPAQKEKFNRILNRM